MHTNLVISTINQILEEVKKNNTLRESKKQKFKKQLESIKKDYSEIAVPEKFKKQYNQLNSKGMDLVKELRGKKDKNKLQTSVEVYIRYLKASLCDFKGESGYLKKYITSFLFTSILFLALSPQFYGFILPVLFFLPIYMGLKSVKQRSISGFYMTMSVIPVGIMTAFTWIRYGINIRSDVNGAIQAIVDSGISEGLAQNLIYIGPIGGCILFIFTCLQLYRGYKSRDLFI